MMTIRISEYAVDVMSRVEWKQEKDSGVHTREMAGQMVQAGEIMAKVKCWRIDEWRRRV